MNSRFHSSKLDNGAPTGKPPDGSPPAPGVLASASAPAASILPTRPMDAAGRALPAPTGPLLVDRREAARLLGVSPGTIDNMREENELPSLKLRGRRLFDVEDLRRYIADRKTTTGSTPAIAAVGVEEND